MEVREFIPIRHHPVRAAQSQENIAAVSQFDHKISRCLTVLLAAVGTTAAWAGLAYLVTWGVGGSVNFAWVAAALAIIFASALLGLSFVMHPQQYHREKNQQ